MTGDIILKVGFVLALYANATSSYSGLVIVAGLMALGFLGFNVYVVMNELLHPRSAFHRRYVFYRAEPTFIRIRLLFELIRRFLYFVVGFAFLFLVLDRLHPALFPDSAKYSSLFMVHFDSALCGISGIGNDPIAFRTDFGVALHSLRMIFALFVWVTFLNLMLVGLTNTGQIGEPLSPYSQMLADMISADMCRQDVEAVIVLAIEAMFKIRATTVDVKSNLFTELGAFVVGIL